MGLTGLIAGQQRVQFIQNQTNTIFQLDASIKEKHSRKSPATKFPVENGYNISDHVIIRPFELTLTGIITDTPIGSGAQLLQEAVTTLISSLLPPIGVVAAGAGLSLFQSIAKSKSPSVAAYGQLLVLQETAQPFDVLTSLYRYSSMWITDISAPRDSETGKALLFDVELEQLILVQPQSVNVAIFANPGLSTNKADLGQQGAGVADRYRQGWNTAGDAEQAVIGPGKTLAK